MDLRRILLEDNIENVHEALSQLENTEENYDKLCEFYTEFEVKGITFKPENVKLIIDFIVEYRLMYANHNRIPEKYEENLSERLKFVEDLVTEYLYYNFQNPIEEIVVLKCVVRFLRPLIHTIDKYDNSNQSENPVLVAILQKIPWHIVQFLICIFVSVKSKRTEIQFKFIDDYFQLLVHEDLIRDVLQLVLNCLRENSFDDEKWKQIYNTYSILQMYYLLLKAAYYSEIFRTKKDTNEKTVHRALQVIGECWLKISGLRYEHFDDTIYPMCDVKYFSAELNRERNKLSHFKKLLTETQKELLAESKSEHLEFSRIFYFMADMIEMVRNEIEKIVVVEYKALIENENVEKLLKRVKGLKISKFKTNPNVVIELIIEEIAFLSKCGLADSFTSVLLYEISLLMKNYHLKVKNSDLFRFIKWINNSSQQPAENIKYKLNTISSNPLINVTMFMTILIQILPDSIKKRYIGIFKNYSQTNQIFLTNPRYRFFREDTIKEFMEKIRGCMSNQRDKERFNELEDILMKRRSLILEVRIFNDAKSILGDWPYDNEKQKVTERFFDSYNDPLNLFLDNSNISDYKKVDDFLKKVKWENRKEIIEGLEKVISKDLTDSLEDIFRNFGINEIADEIHLLDCFEILKQIGIEQSQDYNYLDFDCSIPVARNMRNYLAHGDLYVEIFCPYSKEVVQSHLKIISKIYKNIKRIGFWRQDDFETVRRDLNKHRKWAREAWKTLNFSNDLQTMEEIETFKVRDHNNLSVVHYNLMNTNSENKFLEYLIEKFTDNPHFETNLLFEKLLEESSNFNLNNSFELKKERIENAWEGIRHYNFQNVKTVEFFIDKFLEERELQEKRRLLCIILCFSYQNFNMFQEVYSTRFQTTELLCYSIASNQTDITNFLLEQIKNDVNFEEILKQAIKRNYNLLVSKLLDKIFNVSLKYNIKWSKLVISAAKVGNIEILELLSKNTNILNSETRNLLIKTIMNCNPSIRICGLVVEKYLSPISKEDSELFLHLSCFDERFDILRYLLDEVVPENHWNEIKKFILVSCFNINSLEIVEYLIKKGAYLNFKSLNNFLPFFVSSEIVEVMSKYFGTITYQQEFKNLTFVRNRNVAEVLHKLGYSFDWFEIDSLSLEFILKRNPEPKINTDQLINFLWRNSDETVDLLLKYLKKHKVKFSFKYLPEVVAEIKLKWLSELDWKEPTPKDFVDIINEAVLQKCLTYVNMSLRKCKNLNVYPDFGDIIVFVISHNQQHILKLFQEFGPDLNARYHGQTYLDVAIEKGKGAITDSMRLLSKYGVKCRYDIDFSNLKAQDMLLFGVLKENLYLIQEAFSLGADINFKYKQYRFGTVLHITAYSDGRRKSVIRDSILKSGIDTSIRDIDDNTAFDLGQLYDPTVKIQKDHDNISPFNLFWAGVKRNDIDLMEEALNRGADIHSVIFEPESNSALHVFASNGQLKEVEFLLNKGADLWQKNKLLQYPIEHSIFHDNCDIFKILFSEKLNLKYYFEFAVTNSSVNIVKFLLERGVDVNTKLYNISEVSALEYACKYTETMGFRLLELLIEHNINVTEFHIEEAWKEKNYELLKLISYKVYNYPKTVEELETALEKGLNINLALDLDLRTYLHLACYFQDKEIVKYLLDNGANFLHCDLNWNSPITIALESNNDEMKKTLFLTPSS